MKQASNQKSKQNSVKSSKKDFESEYWKHNYSEPQTMDGIGNAADHAIYLKKVFELDLIDISSIIDLGFGYGYLFQKMLKTFLPYRACGIEPSKHAFNKARSRKLKPVESTNLQLLNIDLLEWCQQKTSKKNCFDLAICTSVFQYLEEKDIDFCLEIISQRAKYVYFTVPTDIELDRQVEDLEFHDTWAKARTRQWYQKRISKYFTFISSRVLESKHFFDEKSTHFTDLLFRF